MAREKGTTFSCVRPDLLREPSVSVSLCGSNCLSHMACHMLLRHERGHKCSGISSCQSNYQRGRRGEQKCQMQHYASVIVGFLFEKHPSEGRLLQKVFGRYLWCVRCCSLSLLFPKEADVRSTTPSLSRPPPPLSLSPQLH